MDYEVLYPVTADAIEVGDVIGIGADGTTPFHVKEVDDAGDVIYLTGISDETGDEELIHFYPDDEVDILGN